MFIALSLKFTGKLRNAQIVILMHRQRKTDAYISHIGVYYIHFEITGDSLRYALPSWYQTFSV